VSTPDLRPPEQREKYPDVPCATCQRSNVHRPHMWSADPDGGAWYWCPGNYS
jgi:hypothetical protein